MNKKSAKIGVICGLYMNAASIALYYRVGAHSGKLDVTGTADEESMTVVGTSLLASRGGLTKLAGGKAGDGRDGGETGVVAGNVGDDVGGGAGAFQSCNAGGGVLLPLPVGIADGEKIGAESSGVALVSARRRGDSITIDDGPSSFGTAKDVCRNVVFSRCESESW
ncbi:MAG: hypothetical protein ACRC46_08850 [Thermoguttaceae bacterium]